MNQQPINYFDLEYSGGFPINNYYYNTHESIPNIFSYSELLKKDVIKKLILKNGFKLFWESSSLNKSKHFKNIEVYKNGIVYVKITYNNGSEDDDSEEFNFEEYDIDTNTSTKEKVENGCYLAIYYSREIDINHITNKLSKHKLEVVKGNKISLIIQSSSGYKLKDYPVKIKPIDIGTHYGTKFIPVYEKIIERLNTKFDKGLVLLHGIPGSGKSSLLKYIATQVNKEVIFIPPFLANEISSPNFIPFLMGHKNSILIIEDAEQILMDRSSGQSSSQGVSNILNLTDGIMSDCLGIQIICTFNVDKKLLDKALLRKGRLISESKFEALPVDESNNLLKVLYPENEYTTDKPLVLTDIYNYEEILYSDSNTPNVKLGFNR